MPPKKSSNNASRDVAKLSRAIGINTQARNQGTENLTWQYQRETVRATPKGTTTLVQERGQVDYAREGNGQWNNSGSQIYQRSYDQLGSNYQGASGGGNSYSVTNVTCTRGGGQGSRGGNRK